MAGMRRVQAGLRALADGDQDAVLHAVNGATEGEAGWMAATLFSVADELSGRLAEVCGTQKPKVLRVFADVMETDVPVNGARVVVAEYLQKEHTDA